MIIRQQQFEPNLVWEASNATFTPIHALCKQSFLSVVLLFSVSILSVFVAAQDENNHPTEEQPYMYFWGEEDLFECWNNFDSNASAGSSSTGYGEIEFPEGQDVSVDFSCNMQMGFSDDFLLKLTNYLSPYEILQSIWKLWWGLYRSNSNND